MKTTKELLGARIKELRRAKGLSQNKLSEKIGIDPKHLSRIEVGKGYPSLDTLEKTAQALGADMRDFFEFVEPGTNRGLKDGIGAFLKEATAEQLRLIYRIVRAIVR